MPVATIGPLLSRLASARLMNYKLFRINSWKNATTLALQTAVGTEYLRIFCEKWTNNGKGQFCFSRIEIDIPDEVLKSDLSPTAKLIVATAMTYPHLSRVELAKLLGIARNTVFAALKTAKVRGLYIGTVSVYIGTVSIKIETIT